MRVSRTAQLHEKSGFVHKFWRCHNREFLLQSQEVKELYFKCTEKALNHPSVSKNVHIHSYCLMDNHTHMEMSYKDDSTHLSSFMRIAHSHFGATFNRLKKRSGKVANERPGTPLIQDEEHMMRVHFYIEANPIRAKMCTYEKLKFYKHSSFKFYAFGIRDQWSHLITIPQWYINLGKTAKQRQAKYRKLFKLYLEKDIGGSKWMFAPFIGTPYWQNKKMNMMKTVIRLRQKIEMPTNTS